MAKVTLDAREAGWRIAAGLLDAERCWRFVCMLRNIEAPGPVACCEMALALSARLKHDIREKIKGDVLDGVLSGVDDFVDFAFRSQDTSEINSFYTEYFDDLVHGLRRKVQALG